MNWGGLRRHEIGTAVLLYRYTNGPRMPKGFAGVSLPVTEKTRAHDFVFAIYPELTDEAVDSVAEAINRFYAK